MVDAGRHHIGSFGSLTQGSRRPGRGVVIRLADGSETAVSPGHLDLVPPDHPLRPEADGHHADWWLDALDDWGPGVPVACFVPRSLPAVCQVLHPWDYRGRLDHHLAKTLVDTLAGATTTPDDVFFAVWEGWGDTPPARFPGAARLDTPSRGHFLLRGPLEGALTSVSASPSADQPVSGIWWPADRAWLVHTEIDFHWTFIAGTERLVQQLTGHPGLEAVPTTHDRGANELETDSPGFT